MASLVLKDNELFCNNPAGYLLIFYNNSIKGPLKTGGGKLIGVSHLLLK